MQQSVKKAIFDANAGYQNFIAAQEVDKNSKLSLDLAEKSYAAGKISIYDLNMAKKKLTNVSLLSPTKAKVHCARWQLLKDTKHLLSPTMWVDVIRY